MPFDWADPFDLDHQLTDEERLVRDTAEGYAQEKLLPRVTSAYLDERFDREIMSEFGELGLLGATVPHEYGGAGLGYVSYGLIARAVERVDSGYRSACSVQSSLVMYPILAYGSEEQRQKYLPKLATGEWIGCFGLTEPDCGSDPGSMRTRAEKTADGYRLTGTKMWITNSPIADVFVVWAKSDAHEGKIRGFVLEKGMAGLSAPKIKEKLSLRASITGEIVMDGVEVGEDALLPNVEGLKGPVRLPQPRPLRHRLGLDGRCRGLLRRRAPVHPRPEAVRPTPRLQPARAAQARQHGDRDRARPPGSLRVGRRLEAGELVPETISLIKRNNCGKALEIARTARDMHGGNGISAEFHVMRHAANLETVNTYEGTHDVHALIMGRAITGLSAF